MNKLEVPREKFSKKCALVFTLEESALSSAWKIICFIQSLIVALIALSISWFFEGVIRDYYVLFSILVGLAYYVVDSTTVKNYRKKIIADMNSAGSFKGKSGFRGYSAHIGNAYVTIVPTLAGNIHFVSYGESDPFLVIKKKHGRFFNYYEFKDVEKLDQKDLRRFIAIPNDLD